MTPALINTAEDNRREFDTVDAAKEAMDDLIDLGVSADNLKLEGNADTTADAEPDPEPQPEPDTSEDTDATTPEVVDAEPASVELGEDMDALPKVSPAEGQARELIQQLDGADMNRLVWDPQANPNNVPYDPRDLPYDKPEPSAEAFDLFATIIEGLHDVTYSVVDVEFSEMDGAYGCTVVIEKQATDDRPAKRLVGVKTSTMTATDAWRERIYSKARRNALKQDIPPTYVAALLARYREVQA